MRTCPKCGAQVESNASLCPSCGTSLEPPESSTTNRASMKEKGSVEDSIIECLQRMGLDVESRAMRSNGRDISSEIGVSASKRKSSGPRFASQEVSPMTGSRLYPRYVTPGFEPFDPVELARETERIICKGDSRKYSDFYATGVYGGIATGYACGCCLRCVFCWVDWSRDFPEEYGTHYTPEEVFSKLDETAHKFNVRKLRISGSEPTIGKKHLLSLMEHVEQSDFDVFILETNGILLGEDRNYVKEISKFRKPHVRVSLKAGNPEAFTRKTGAKAESFQLPFKAIRNLLDYDVRFHVAAMSLDPRLVDAEERRNLVRKVAEIDPKLLLGLEEEVVDPYKTTLTRLKYAGMKLTWPLRKVYTPIHLTSQE